MMPRPRTLRTSRPRSRSNSEEGRKRRSKKDETVMQLFRKSPERPRLGSYTNDAVPPTQRTRLQ